MAQAINIAPDPDNGDGVYESINGEAHVYSAIAATVPEDLPASVTGEPPYLQVIADNDVCAEGTYNGTSVDNWHSANNETTSTNEYEYCAVYNDQYANEPISIAHQLQAFAR